MQTLWNFVNTPRNKYQMYLFLNKPRTFLAIAYQIWIIILIVVCILITMFMSRGIFFLLYKCHCSIHVNLIALQTKAVQLATSYCFGSICPCSYFSPLNIFCAFGHPQCCPSSVGHMAYGKLYSTQYT